MPRMADPSLPDHERLYIERGFKACTTEPSVLRPFWRLIDVSTSIDGSADLYNPEDN